MLEKLRARSLALALACAALAAPANAEPLAPERVPEALKPWVDWALHGHEAERCPFLHAAPGSAECAWPARLELALGARQGAFVQRWRVFTDAWVPLPGDAKHWPQDVQVDGRPAPVVERQQRPSVRLAPGVHDVRGELHWDALPELLQIPPETGLLAVALNGQPTAFPKRDAQGRLWLRSATADAAGAESRLEVTVHRRIRDEIPLRVTTQIRLEVSGPAREVVLSRALPEGAVPMSLASPLPARLDADGRLRVQVRPGTYFLQVEARLPGPVDALTLPRLEGAWDEREEWVFDARPSLRLVSVEGAPSIDPQQTELPEAWRALPAFAMEPGASLRFVTKRRGDADPAPDRLELARTWWLDFDGGGYTVTDRISGAVVRSDRLAMAPSIDLGRVAVNGQDQFITKLPGDERPGVEIPRGEIEISADSRIPRMGSRVPALGWDQDFQNVSAELQLPPGWRLLHASGVDDVSWSWVTRWTLLDLFVVLVVAMAFLRLFGPLWGALALVGLALSYTEPGAPRWVWVCVLAGEGLRRALVRGRLGFAVRALWQAALLALVLLSLPFALAQIRSGCFPALDAPRGIEALPRAPAARADAPAMDQLAIAEAELARAPEAPRERRAVMKESAALGVSQVASSYFQSWAPDPKARITTGPGLPTWSWRSVALRWRGPVERGQSLQLLLAPPWLNLALSLLRVALLAALVLRVLPQAFSGAAFPPRRAASAAAAMAAVLLAAPWRSGAADLPTPELLNELRARLLEKPACHPQCAASPRLRLEVEPAGLVLRFEVDAAVSTAVPLPGGARDWVPEQVIVDGAPASALRRADDGSLWLQVDAGSHQVLIAGALPERDTIELPLPLAPHRVEVSSRGWTVAGIGEDGTPESNLQLTRVRDPNAATRPALEASGLPGFVSVTRTLRLGLSWQVETSIARLTPPDATLVLELPLLAGESVTTAGIRVENGKAFVSLGPGVVRTGWVSALDVTPGLELLAPESVASIETWILDTSPIWHVEVEGIPPIHQEASGVRLREWRPWPGERVGVRVSRPEGVEGATLTLDSSRLEVSPGLRATDAALELRLRSSQGGQHVIVLPEASVLERVTLDGVEQPISLEGRELTLPLTPGTRTLGIAWREPRGIATRFRGPEVDLRAPSVNADVVFSLPADRWLLWAGGPRLGPSVLFWPLLAVLAALALGLGRVRSTPLRWWHWLLLGLGLTQVPPAAGALVAGWLLALGWRGAHGAALRGRWFDLLQLALALWTLAALAVLFYSIQQGLLGLPEMQVAGHGSSAHELRWYQDRSGATLPQPWVVSIPLLAYRAVMLAWALWLAIALLRWLRWGWTQYTQGELWRGRRRVSAA